LKWTINSRDSVIADVIRLESTDEILAEAPFRRDIHRRFALYYFSVRSNGNTFSNSARIPAGGSFHCVSLAFTSQLHVLPSATGAICNIRILRWNAWPIGRGRNCTGRMGIRSDTNGNFRFFELGLYAQRDINSVSDLRPAM
jgi:hypothetical protein